MIAVLLFEIAGILFVEGTRFGAGAPHLAPWPTTANRWAMMTGVMAGLAFLWMRRRGLGREQLGWRRLGVIWGVWGAAPLAVWAVGDQIVQRGAESFCILGAAALAVAGLVAERREWIPRIWRGSAVASAVNLGLLAVGVALVFWLRATGHSPQPATAPSEWVVALATYPLYAFAQLLVFLVLPVAYLRREGRSSGTAVVVCALLFAMLHWPNPVLLLITGGAMAVWVRLYQRGASLVSIALCMGGLGALFAQGLDADFTGHMRVGPGYVLRMQQLDHLATFEARVRFLASDEAFADSGGDLESWLRWLHRKVFHREIEDEVLEGWTTRIRRGVRSRVLRDVYQSPEFARKHGPQPEPEEGDARLLFSLFRPRNPAQSDYEQLRSDATYARLGGDFRAYLQMVYRELLGREASDAELDTWPENPVESEREEVAVMFLREGPERDFYIFESANTPLWWPGEPN